MNLDIRIIGSEKITNYGEKKVAVSFSNGSKDLTVKKSLSIQFKNAGFDEKSFEDNCLKLIESFNKGSIKEYMMLSAIGKKPSNLARNLIDKPVGSTEKLRGVSFSSKSKKPIFGKYNSIALFGSLILVKEGTGIDVKIYFSLKRFELLSLAPKYKTHERIYKAQKLTMKLGFGASTNNISPASSENGQEVVKYFIDKTKSKLINIFDEKNALQFRENNDFISAFVDFLETKRDEKITVFQLKHHENKLLGVVNKQREDILDQRGIKLINDNDNNIKVDIKINKTENFDYVEYANESIDYLNNLNETLKNKIVKFQSSQNDLKAKKLEENQKLNEIDSIKALINKKITAIKANITKQNNYKTDFNNDVKSLSKRIFSLKDLSSVTKNLISKLEDEKNLSKTLKKLTIEGKNKKSDKKQKSKSNNKLVKAEKQWTDKKKEITDVIKNIEHLINNLFTENSYSSFETTKDFNKIITDSEKISDLTNKKFHLMKNKVSELETILEKLDEDLKQEEKEFNKVSKKANEIESIIGGLDLEIKGIRDIINNTNGEIETNLNNISVWSSSLIYAEKKDLNFRIFKNNLIFNEDSQKNKEAFKFENSQLIDLEKELCESQWYISSFDLGLLQKNKRGRNSFNDVKYGRYKNPYLVASLEKPLCVEINEELDFTGIPKDLNERQVNAVKAAISSDDIMYLQGPPGTGKTQTISAIAKYYLDNEENVLITSSTHAAIDNFYKRLETKIDKDNPNLFYYRYKYGTNNGPYSANMFLGRFLKAIDKKALPENNTSNNANIELINSEDWDGFQFYTNIVAERAINILEKKQDIEELKSFFKYDVDASEFDSDSEFVEDFKDHINITVKRISRTKNSLLNAWDNILNKVDHEKLSFAQITNDKKLIKVLSKEINVNKPGHEILADFATIEYENLDKQKDEFANIVVNKNLINVYGITTTSRKDIEINGIKKHLFFDIPIDAVILDEVSKSITSEIISNSLIAKKVILSGDYRQLPPVVDIDKALYDEFTKHETFEKLSNTAIFNDYNRAQKLFANSLFKNQVEEIKKLKRHFTTRKFSYEFLNEQFRFTKEIMNMVNISYDGNEKLTMPKKGGKNFVNKPILIKSKTIENSFGIIDTSVISNDYIEFLEKRNINEEIVKKIKLDPTAFDQQNVLKTGIIQNSRINEYNAFVIAQTIKWNLEKGKLIPSDIGVIAMTISQVKMIKSYVRDVFKIEDKIRISTVDNFQGDEMPVVFVDLVRAEGSFESGKLIYRTKRNLDFYKKIERLNVAISRAQEKLVLVGAIEGHLAGQVTSEIIKSNGVKESMKPFQIFVEGVEGGLIKW